MTDTPVKPSRHHLWRITRRALSKSWDDSIFSESAQAAFWSALSLPPLLLGMLGSLAYVAPLFGPDTMAVIESSAGDSLILWDTPGFGDSTRVLKRLRQGEKPMGDGLATWQLAGRASGVDMDPLIIARGLGEGVQPGGPARRRWMPPPVAPDAMYIDPAAGSMILQVIAAGIVSVLALARNVRRNLVQGLKSLFTRRADR